MKNSARNAVIFVLLTAALLGILVCSALIPREAIRKQMTSSADYLCETEQFKNTLDDIYGSKVDHYADAVLLNIAWHFDAENPLKSVLRSDFYMDTDDESDGPHWLAKTLAEDLPANTQYLRYWHGSIAIVRPLMTVLTLPQIYVLHGIVLALLAGGLLVRLILRKAYVPAAGILIGMIGTACWFVPSSLEFTWVFLILFVQLNLVLMKSFPKDWGKRGTFFLISGMVTNYLDFLSCETLTLLMPLLLLLWLERKEGKPSWKELGKAALLWLIGYGGMYLAKWGISSLVLGENVWPYVSSYLTDRVAGPVSSTDYVGEFFGALLRNIAVLFPLEYGTFGIVIWVALLVAAGYFGYVHHRKGFDRTLVLMYTVIGVVPLVRFLALINHSFRHYFFTYRAMLTTLTAIVLIVAELTGWGQQEHGKT